MANIVGTEGNDFLIDTPLDDEISFSDGEDSLGLSSGIDFGDLSINNNTAGTDTVIRDTTNGNEQLVIIKGVDASLITIDDFVTI